MDVKSYPQWPRGHQFRDSRFHSNTLGRVGYRDSDPWRYCRRGLGWPSPPLDSTARRNGSIQQGTHPSYL